MTDDGTAGNPDGVVDRDDLCFFFAYDEGWRMVATYRSTDSSPKEQFVHHMAGLGGYGGSSYIDAVILRERDANTAWASAADGTLEERLYYVQNWRADVVAIVNSAGKLVERVRYSAYGIPTAFPAGDCDYDGDWDASDSTDIGSNYTPGSTYAVLRDTDLDGDVDAADVTHANSITGGYQTLGRDVLTSAAVRNRIGYAGYQYDPTFSGLDRHLFHVRHRVYDAEAGRWTRRDPLGYVDGMGLYEYVRNRPITTTDQMGLVAAACRSCASNAIPHSCSDSDGNSPGDPRYDRGYQKGKWCLQQGATTWTDCMLCCTEGISHPDDPYGWGCRSACEKGSSVDPPPPPFVPECWGVQPIGPGGICFSYGLCDSYLGANARCFCLCMGSDPWSDFVRACLACHYRRGESPANAHKDCYEEADRRYPGQRPYVKLAECAATCWSWQLYFCHVVIGTN